MKYLSIDIETTGLDPEISDILEIGAVLDDLDSPKPVEDLPYLRIVVVKDRYSTDAYCADLHHDLWREIQAVDKTRLKGEGWYYGRWDCMGGKIVEHKDIEQEIHQSHIVPLTLYSLPDFVIDKINDFVIDKDIEDKITAAGKNFGSFDLQFLKKLHGAENLSFHHRAFDPGSLYYQKGDIELPRLDKCLNRAGLVPTKYHTSLGDAIDVIRLIRHKFLEKI